ncbi:MAG: hypothetical protein SWY16_03920 [Cyanobacteriota bacterium]|nr:hypothetical protein [Cyanobacteriota bacterium]
MLPPAAIEILEQAIALSQVDRNRRVSSKFSAYEPIDTQKLVPLS